MTTTEKYKEALEAIVKMRHTPRAYRHAKFETLIKLAQTALLRDEKNAQ